MAITIDELMADRDPILEQSVSVATLFHLQELMEKYPDSDDLPSELRDFVEKVIGTATALQIKLQLGL